MRVARGYGVMSQQKSRSPGRSNGPTKVVGSKATITNYFDLQKGAQLADYFGGTEAT